MPYSFVMRHSILAHVFLIFCLIFSRCSSHERYLKLSFPNLSDEFYNITWNHTTLDRQLSKSIESSQCWDFNQHITISSRNITLDLFVCIKQNKIILTGFDKLLNKSYLSQIVCRKEKFDYKPCDDELNDLSKYFQSSIELSISEMNNESGYDATSICSTNPECRSGSCCNTRTCRLLPAHHICRSSSDCCDIEEYCTGDSSVCPEDDYFIDGVACRSKDNYEGVCKRGSCLSLLGECRRFHPLMRSGISFCRNKCTEFACLFPPNFTPVFLNVTANFTTIDGGICLSLTKNASLCLEPACSERGCSHDKICKCKNNQNCSVKRRCLPNTCSAKDKSILFMIWLLPMFILSLCIIIIPYFFWIKYKKIHCKQNLHSIGPNIFVTEDCLRVETSQSNNELDIIYDDESINLDASEQSEQLAPNNPVEGVRSNTNNTHDLSNLFSFETERLEASDQKEPTLGIKEERLLSAIIKIVQNMQFGKIIKVFDTTAGIDSSNSTSIQHVVLNMTAGGDKAVMSKMLYNVYEKRESTSAIENKSKITKTIEKPNPTVTSSITSRRQIGQMIIQDGMSTARQNNSEDMFSCVVENVVIDNVINENFNHLNVYKNTNCYRVQGDQFHSNHCDVINVTENNSTNHRQLYNWEISCSKCSDCPRIDEMETQLLLRDNKVVKDNYLRSLITLTGKLHKSRHKFSNMKEEPADLSTLKDDANKSDTAVSQGISLKDILCNLKDEKTDSKTSHKLSRSISSECSDCSRLVNLINHKSKNLLDKSKPTFIINSLLEDTIVLHMLNHLNSCKSSTLLLKFKEYLSSGSPGILNLALESGNEKDNYLHSSPLPTNTKSIDKADHSGRAGNADHIEKEESEILHSSLQAPKKTHVAAVIDEDAKNKLPKIRNIKSAKLRKKPSEDKNADKINLKQADVVYSEPRINATPLIKKISENEKNAKARKTKGNYQGFKRETNDDKQPCSLESESVPKCPIHKIPMELVSTLKYVDSDKVKKISKSEPNLIKHDMNTMESSDSNQDNSSINLKNRQRSSLNGFKSVIKKDNTDLLYAHRRTPPKRGQTRQREDSNDSFLGMFRNYELNQGVKKKPQAPRMPQGKYIYKGSTCPSCDHHSQKTRTTIKLRADKNHISYFSPEWGGCSDNNISESKYLEERRLSPTSFIPSIHHLRCCSSCNDLYMK